MPPHTATASPSDGDEFYELMRSLARRLAHRTPLDPTELAHEGYLRLHDRDDVRARPTEEQVRYYTRTLLNLVRNEWRKRRAKSVSLTWLTDTLSKETAGTGTGLPLEVSIALNELARVDGRQAEVVRLMDGEGLGREVVAERLGISQRTVSRDRQLGLAWLRRRLGGTPPFPHIDA